MARWNPPPASTRSLSHDRTAGDYPRRAVPLARPESLLGDGLNPFHPTIHVTMRFPSRSFSVALAALTVVACSDSAGPLDVFASQELLEGIGPGMAFVFENGALQLTAEGAMGTVDFPSFSVRRSNRVPLGAALNVQRAGSLPSFQAVDRWCGLPSQDPPTDTDADNVPDNLTITFAPPACRVTDEANDTFDL